jgi:hypothetical protein
MILPSKELISEVLSKEVEEEERFIDSNSLTYVNSGIYEDINIYEFAFKCKELAFDKGFVLKSYKKQGAFSGTYHYAIDINDKICEWLANTEYEAIFKACEWIMEQTKCGS